MEKKTFSAILQDKMLEKGLSQADLSRMTGIPTSSLLIGTFPVCHK